VLNLLKNQGWGHTLMIEIVSAFLVLWAGENNQVKRRAIEKTWLHTGYI